MELKGHVYEKCCVVSLTVSSFILVVDVSSSMVIPLLCVYLAVPHGEYKDKIITLPFHVSFGDSLSV